MKFPVPSCPTAKPFEVRSSDRRSGFARAVHIEIDRAEAGPKNERGALRSKIQTARAGVYQQVTLRLAGDINGGGAPRC